MIILHNLLAIVSLIRDDLIDFCLAAIRIISRNNEEDYMKRLAFSILVLVLTLSFTSVYADTSDDIASLERQYFEALENQDEKKMDSLLADDFEISSMTSNWSMNKEEFS